eukprot:6491679-Amphidinium_carterae.3
MASVKQQPAKRKWSSLAGGGLAAAAKGAAKAKADVKRGKRGQEGLCSCCGSSSQAQDNGNIGPVWLVCVLNFSKAQVVKWALYSSPSGTSSAQPVEDRCEPCFKAWEEAFSFWDWDMFMDQKTKSPRIAEFFDAVKQRLLVGAKQLPGPSVGSVKSVQIELSRVFHTMSEKDMRKHLAQDRVKKSQVDGIPCLSLPSDSTGMLEPTYVFSHPDAAAQREMRVKTILEVRTEKTELAENSLWFAQAAEVVFEEGLKQRVQGLPQLLAKEMVIPTFEEWEESLQLEGQTQQQQQQQQLDVLAGLGEQPPSQLWGAAAVSDKAVIGSINLPTPALSRGTSQGTLSTPVTPQAKHVQSPEVIGSIVDPCEANSVMSDETRTLAGE